MIISYTEEDIKDLIIRLHFYVSYERGVPDTSSEDILKGNTSAAYTYIRYSTEFLCVYAADLMSFLKGPITSKYLYNMPGCKKIAFLAKIIRGTDFSSIPLYIDVFPEIASWRLRIGK